MKRLVVGFFFAVVAFSFLTAQTNNEAAVPAWGEMTMTTPAGTATTSGTPLKALGTTTLGDAIQFDMPVNNRLRYTGTKTSVFLCSVNTALESDAGSVRARIFMAPNGAEDQTTEIDRNISGANDHGASGTSFIVTLAQNEYVELWVDSLAGNPTLTINHMVFRCVKLN